MTPHATGIADLCSYLVEHEDLHFYVTYIFTVILFLIVL